MDDGDHLEIDIPYQELLRILGEPKSAHALEPDGWRVLSV